MRLLKIKNKLKIGFTNKVCTNRLYKSVLQIKSGRILDILWAFFNNAIIPLALVGYEMIIYSQLKSNAHSWNNC